jgi:hypothetical protein
MTLSENAIKNFQKLYSRQFMEQLSDVEAEQKGLALLRLFRLIYTKAAPPGWQSNRQKGGVNKKVCQN